jgi:hypothetical protein
MLHRTEMRRGELGWCLLGSKARLMNASPQSHHRHRERLRRDGDAPAEFSPTGRRRERARMGRVRLLGLALAIVVLTWLPGSVGGAIGFPLLGDWGVVSGYTGLSWVLPALLVGLVAAGAWRDRGLRLHRFVGVVVGVTAALVFLVFAAQLVGS